MNPARRVKSIIQFKHVTKRYSSIQALKNVDLDIPDQQIFVIVGPSGSGKSTLLKLINRLIHPTTGQILLNRRPIERYPVRQFRLKMGNLLQAIALFPNLTVDQNITIQLKVLRRPKPVRLKIAHQLLKKVGLGSHYGSRYPRELSGGEQQRVGIARALATRPRLILMDEPFSALDPINRRKLQNLVLRLHRGLHNTIIFVTHDMHEALKMGERIAVLYRGRVVQVGSAADLLQNPRNALVSQLFHQKLIRDVIQEGCAQPQTAVTAPLLRSNVLISQLAESLKHHTAVNVKDDGRIWQITVNNFLTFMSNGGDHGHA